MPRKRGRKANTHVLGFSAIVGDAYPLTVGKYPECPKCHEVVKDATLSLIQHGFDFHRETDLFYCHNHHGHIAFTYDVAHEETDNGN